MKIRIGNDIRLKIRLFFNEDESKTVNVLSIKPYFINTTLKDKFEKEHIKKNRFVGRFPIEPFIDEFEPSAYAINSSGYPKYHAIVKNQYNGFGIRPNWKKSFPIKEVNITEYLAECERTQNRDTVTVTFPAEAQLYPGTYKLVVVAKIYDPGYRNNERTITVDYCNVFELVSSCEEGVDKPVQINIDNDSESSSVPGDVYVVSGTYSTDSLTLVRNDGRDVNIHIDDWYEEY